MKRMIPRAVELESVLLQSFLFHIELSEYVHLALDALSRYARRAFG